MTFLGGVIAKKCFKIDETLGYYKNKWEPGKKLRETAWFIDGMNRGGMRYPTDEFFTSLKLMNLLFERYHPNGKLRKGTVHHFIKKLLQVQALAFCLKKSCLYVLRYTLRRSLWAVWWYLVQQLYGCFTFQKLLTTIRQVSKSVTKNVKFDKYLPWFHCIKFF